MCTLSLLSARPPPAATSSSSSSSFSIYSISLRIPLHSSLSNLALSTSYFPFASISSFGLLCSSLGISLPPPSSLSPLSSNPDGLTKDGMSATETFLYCIHPIGCIYLRGGSCHHGSLSILTICQPNYSRGITTILPPPAVPTVEVAPPIVHIAPTSLGSSTCGICWFRSATAIAATQPVR